MDLKLCSPIVDARFEWNKHIFWTFQFCCTTNFMTKQAYFKSHFEADFKVVNEVINYQPERYIVDLYV